jgi:hypothetical protein
MLSLPCLTCSDQPFTHSFPRADIHELLAPDLLHQLIKGMFKDHLVEWVGEYLIQTHGPAAALEIIEDIDHRYAFLVARLAAYTDAEQDICCPSISWASSIS